MRFYGYFFDFKTEMWKKTTLNLDEKTHDSFHYFTQGGSSPKFYYKFLSIQLPNSKQEGRRWCRARLQEDSSLPLVWEFLDPVSERFISLLTLPPLFCGTGVLGKIKTTLKKASLQENVLTFDKNHTGEKHEQLKENRDRFPDLAPWQQAYFNILMELFKIPAGVEHLQELERSQIPIFVLNDFLDFVRTYNNPEYYISYPKERREIIEHFIWMLKEMYGGRQNMIQNMVDPFFASLKFALTRRIIDIDRLLRAIQDDTVNDSQRLAIEKNQKCLDKSLLNDLSTAALREQQLLQPQPALERPPEISTFGVK